jgi:periplasmic protein TonB
MRSGLMGVVELEILVGVDGRPIDVRIVRSSGHRVLDQAARRTVLSKWTFVPAMRDGRAVEAIGRVPVEFRLD